MRFVIAEKPSVAQSIAGGEDRDGEDSEDEIWEEGSPEDGQKCVLLCYRGVEVIPPIPDPDHDRSR